MDGGERVGRGRPNVGGGGGREEAPVPQDLRERPPRNELLDQVGPVRVQPDVVDSHERGMREPGQAERLVPEPGQGPGVPQEPRPRRLDHDGASQHPVRGEIHLAAPALVEQRPDLVPPPDHVAGAVRGRDGRERLHTRRVCTPTGPRGPAASVGQ